MKTIKIILASMALSGLVLAGCGDDDGMGDTGPADTGTGDTSPTDTGTGDTTVGDTAVDTAVPGDCTRYCDALEVNCGSVPQYADRAECEAYCAAAGWPVGTEGEMAGNTIECRIYHAGAPASMDAAMHCPHAGPSGAQVCGGVDYRTEAAAMFTRVDRLGMPAVSTALISSGTKNDYNDDDPSVDAMGTPPTYAGELITNIAGLHTALDDDLTGLSLTPCSGTTPAALPECVAQQIGAGAAPTVVSLVIPDTLQIDGSGTAGFPNGRMLADQVMDVTLAIILLDLDTHTPTTLAEVPLNPAANDATFSDAFPYLAPAHTP